MSLFCSTGVHAVAYAFPKVRLVTTAVDREVSDEFHILPGIGMAHHNTLVYLYCRHTDHLHAMLLYRLEEYSSLVRHRSYVNFAFNPVMENKG